MLVYFRKLNRYIWIFPLIFSIKNTLLYSTHCLIFLTFVFQKNQRYIVYFRKKIIFSPVSYVFVFTTPYLIKNTLLYQPHFLSFLAFLSKKMLIYQFFLEQHISYYTTKISVLFLFIKKKYTSILTSFLIFWTFFQKLPLFQCILENKNKSFFASRMDVIFTYFFDQKYGNISTSFSQFLLFFSKKIPIQFISENKNISFFTTIIWVLFLLYQYSIKNTILYLPHFLSF